MTFPVTARAARGTAGETLPVLAEDAGRLRPRTWCVGASAPRRCRSSKLLRWSSWSAGYEGTTHAATATERCPGRARPQPGQAIRLRCPVNSMTRDQRRIPLAARRADIDRMDLGARPAATGLSRCACSSPIAGKRPLPVGGPAVVGNVRLCRRQRAVVGRISSGSMTRRWISRRSCRRGPARCNGVAIESSGRAVSVELVVVSMSRFAVPGPGVRWGGHSDTWNRSACLWNGRLANG